MLVLINIFFQIKDVKDFPFVYYAVPDKYYNFHSFLKPVSVDLQVEMNKHVSFFSLAIVGFQGSYSGRL